MDETVEIGAELTTKKRQRSNSKDEDLIELSEDDGFSDEVEKMSTGEISASTISTASNPKAKRSGTPKKKPKLNETVPSSKRAHHPISTHNLTESEAIEMRASLLAWYDENQRQMPWRKPSDAYHAKFSAKLKEGEYYDPQTSAFDQAYGALVSELMLQQTQVSTVRSYFVKWMKAFPTVEALAKASLDEVNAVWAGLGYYRRAKLLHECAKAIVAGGKGIPSKASELLALPGLGRYTAGAIASVVFGEAAPIVDGNVVRVMTRFRAIGADAKSQTVQKLLWRLAEISVDPARPGDFNQALMELGATVCTKANPSCDSCPVSTQCLALKEEKMSYKAKPPFASISSSKLSESTNSASKGSNDDSTTDIEDLCSICTDLSPTMTVTKYPVKGAKKAKKKMTSFVTVLRHRTKSQTEADCMYLVKKRPDGGLLAGFWEFPTLDLPMTQVEEDDEENDEEEATEDKKGSATTNGAVTVIDKEAVDANLRRSFNIDLGAHENVSRRSIGTYEHKFTHIDQTVLIESLEIVSEIRPEISEEDSKAEQKEPLSPKATLKAKKTAVPEKGQRSITSMFAKSPAKK